MGRPRKTKAVVPMIAGTTNVINDISTLVNEEEKVGSVIGKERSLKESGVSRKKVYNVIRELLEAEVVTREYDKERGWVEKRVADVDKRVKGAELALKAYGDLKEMGGKDSGVTYNKVVYQWNVVEKC